MVFHVLDIVCVCLQEWWGMNQQIKDEAKEIGEQGNFVTLVPGIVRFIIFEITF